MGKHDNEFLGQYKITALRRLKNKRGQLLSMVSLIPLSACGGGGSPAPSTPVVPLGPDYTENPAGTFTGRDNANLTLSQGSATADLTVNSNGGNDSITTGSGNDVITGGSGGDTIASGDGNDIILGGLGADVITAGAGDDIIIVIGTTGANDYTDSAITNPAGSGMDLSSLLSLSDINGHSTSDIITGDSIDGGTGSDTLVIYGTVDLSGITIANLATLQVNSNVTLTAAQLAQFTTVNGDGSSIINIVNENPNETHVIDLTSIDLTNIATLTTSGNVEIRISSLDDLAGIANITGITNLTMVLIDDGTGSNSINISDLASVVSGVAEIEIEDTVTLVIDDATSIANMGITELSGVGTVLITAGPQPIDFITKINDTSTLTVNNESGSPILLSMGLSSNEIIRGTDGVEFSFEVSGGPVTIYVEVTNDPWDGTGGDETVVHSFTASQGTMTVPMTGLDLRYSETSSSYTIEAYHISQIYIQDSLGGITYLTNETIEALGIDTKVVITSTESTDQTPPELINFELLTDEANLDAYGRPTFNIEASDPESGISYISVYATNDVGNEMVVFYSSNDIVSGAANVNKWATNHYSIYKIVIVNDAAEGPQQEITYTAEQLHAMGFTNTEFDVTATREYPEELHAVNLTEFSFSNSTIDLSTIQTIEIQFDTGEPISRGVTVWLVDEDGNNISVAGIGSAGSGTISISLPSDIIAGTYYIEKVEAYGYWEVTEYSRAELETLGFSTTIELVGEVGEIARDTTPPEIISLEILDTVINMDEGEFYIPTRSEIYDTPDNPHIYARYVTDDGRYILVSITNNATGGYMLDIDQAAGVYHLLDVRAQGANGIDQTYSGASLDQLNLPPSIEIINSLSDTEPANVTEFNFVDDYIDMAAGENQVQIAFTITDNFSGVADFLVSLRGPNEEKYHLFANGESGLISLTLPEDAPSGTYTVYQLRTRDGTWSAFNVKRYFSYDEDYSMYEWNNPIEYLQDLGFETSFEVYNDNDGPSLTLTTFSLSQSSITLGDGQSHQMVTFSTSASEGMIDGMLIKFIDANGVLHSNYANGISGTTPLSFDSDSAVSGVYSLHSVTLYDHNGNSHIYTGTEIQSQFGDMATSFTIANPSYAELVIPDNTPYTYLPIETVSPTGDPMIDGLLQGVQYTMPEDGSPLIITYSFVNPESSVFDQSAGYAHPDVNYEEANLLTSLTGEQQAIVRGLFDEIESYANIIFVEVEDTGESSAGHIRFAWTSGWLETGVIDNSSAWASYPENTAKAGDIWLSANILPDAMEQDVINALFHHTIAHEIGHTLGLKHPFESSAAFGYLPLEYDGNDYTAMSYNRVANSEIYSNSFSPNHFMWLDIQALQHLYGENIVASEADDAYVIAFTAYNYFTIWDVGGNDTIDISSSTFDLDINLTPNSWSNVGTSYAYGAYFSEVIDHTIYIAPDTIIENAIGGSGNDTIRGNDADNILTSGLGDDVFVFDAAWGDDTVTDFEDGSDTLDLSDTSLTFADLTVTQSGSDTIVADADGNSITLTGLTSTDITADDFIFG